MRQVQEGLSYERGCHEQFQEAGQCNRMHPLHEVHRAVSGESAEAVALLQWGTGADYMCDYNKGKQEERNSSGRKPDKAN